MKMMGFDVRKMADEIAAPFNGRLEAVELEIVETNEKLDRMIELLEVIANDASGKN